MKISNKAKEYIKRLSKKHKLKLVIIFGSSVSGKIHTHSDIDIAVLPKKNVSTFKMYSDLVNGFSKIFPEREIDLSFINRSDPLLLFNICKDMQLLYGTKRDLNNFKIYSFKKYIDYQPYFEMESNFVDTFISRSLYANR